MSFQPADFVFAKLRGYPPWPARIQSIVKGKGDLKFGMRAVRYIVIFYGTYEGGVVSERNLVPYTEESRERNIVGKRFIKRYKIAINHIEQDIEVFKNISVLDNKPETKPMLQQPVETKRLAYNGITFKDLFIKLKRIDETFPCLKNALAEDALSQSASTSSSSSCTCSDEEIEYSKHFIPTGDIKEEPADDNPTPYSNIFIKQEPSCYTEQGHQFLNVEIKKEPVFETGCEGVFVPSQYYTNQTCNKELFDMKEDNDDSISMPTLKIAPNCSLKYQSPKKKTGGIKKSTKNRSKPIPSVLLSTEENRSKPIPSVLLSTEENRSKPIPSVLLSTEENREKLSSLRSSKTLEKLSEVEEKDPIVSCQGCHLRIFSSHLELHKKKCSYTSENINLVPDGPYACYPCSICPEKCLTYESYKKHLRYHKCQTVKKKKFKVNKKRPKKIKPDLKKLCIKVSDKRFKEYFESEKFQQIFNVFEKNETIKLQKAEERKNVEIMTDATQLKGEPRCKGLEVPNLNTTIDENVKENVWKTSKSDNVEIINNIKNEQADDLERTAEEESGMVIVETTNNNTNEEEPEIVETTNNTTNEEEPEIVETTNNNTNEEEPEIVEITNSNDTVENTSRNLTEDSEPEILKILRNKTDRIIKSTKAIITKEWKPEMAEIANSNDKGGNISRNSTEDSEIFKLLRNKTDIVARTDVPVTTVTVPNVQGMSILKANVDSEEHNYGGDTTQSSPIVNSAGESPVIVIATNTVVNDVNTMEEEPYLFDSHNTFIINDQTECIFMDDLGQNELMQLASGLSFPHEEDLENKQAKNIEDASEEFNLSRETEDFESDQELEKSVMNCLNTLDKDLEQTGPNVEQPPTDNEELIKPRIINLLRKRVLIPRSRSLRLKNSVSDSVHKIKNTKVIKLPANTLILKPNIVNLTKIHRNTATIPYNNSQISIGGYDQISQRRGFPSILRKNRNVKKNKPTEPIKINPKKILSGCPGDNEIVVKTGSTISILHKQADIAKSPHKTVNVSLDSVEQKKQDDYNQDDNVSNIVIKDVRSVKVDKVSKINLGQYEDRNLSNVSSVKIDKESKINLCQYEDRNLSSLKLMDRYDVSKIIAAIDAMAPDEDDKVGGKRIAVIQDECEKSEVDHKRSEVFNSNTKENEDDDDDDIIEVYNSKTQ